MKIKKLKKIFIAITIGLSITFSMKCMAFGITEPYERSNLKRYKLVKTITAVSDGTYDAIDVRLKIMTGAKIIDSPYFQNISDFKISNGTFEEDSNGTLWISVSLGDLKPGEESKPIIIEREFTTGGIDYHLENNNFSSIPLVDGEKYLLPEPTIESNDERIIALAQKLTAEKTNVEDKAYEIFKWVNSNMTYEHGEFANKGALSALINKKGVCEDYTALFIALCRASNIPARAASGFSNYEGSQSNPIDLTNHKHMWPEFYMPTHGWIIVEPTAKPYNWDNISLIENPLFAKQSAANHIVEKYMTGNAEIEKHMKGKPGQTSVNIEQNIQLIEIDEKGEEDNQAKIANATKLVGIAEASLTRTDYTNAVNAVNSLEDGADKILLQTRLDAVLKSIEANEKGEEDNQAKIANATKLVGIAEASLTRTDYTNAVNAVNSLEDGADKILLQTRLDAVLKSIEANEKGEEDNQAKIANATKLVGIAEASLTRTDYTNAVNAVNSLEDGTVKISLQTRLDAVLKSIEANEKGEEDNQAKIANATKLVGIAEASLTRTDYTNAVNAVNSLEDGTDKILLQTRLDAVLKSIEANEKGEEDNQAKIANATKLVGIAEASLTRTDYTNAVNAVNSLEDGTDKILLQTRLDAVLKSIEATEKGEKDNQAKIANATKLVGIAEASLTRTDYTNAVNVVNSLEDGADKILLQTRLDAVLKSIEATEKGEKDNQAKIANATKLVGIAERTLTRESYNNAVDAVNSLEDGTVKISLQTRLDAVLKSIEATEKGEKGEKDSNKDNEAKIDNTIKHDISNVNTAKNTEAIKSVEKVGRNSTLDNYIKSMQLVYNLDASIEREFLLDELDDILNTVISQNENNEKIKKVEKIVDAVKDAENKISPSSYDKAINLVSTLNGMNLGKIQNRINDRLSIVNTKISNKKMHSKFPELIEYPFLETKNTKKTWSVKFNQPLDKTTVINNNIYMKNSKGQKIDCVVNYNNNCLTITPTNKLKIGEQYVVCISNKVLGATGKTLDKNSYFTFEVKTR